MKKLPVLLALSVGLLLGNVGISQAQTMGPPEPKKRPAAPAGVKPLDQVKGSFMRLFKKEEASTKLTPADGKEKKVEGEEPSASDKTASDSADKSSEKPKPKVPARAPLLNQPEGPDAKIAEPEVSKENPPAKIVTLDNPTNPFGFIDAQNKLARATQLIEKKDLSQARLVLTPLRQWLVDSTEAHINLYKALSNVSNAKVQAELEKQLALQFALLRDKSMYQLSRVDISEKNYKTAIKDLIEVVKSQPRGDIGIKAYQLLQEIGFTEKLQLVE